MRTSCYDRSYNEQTAITGEQRARLAATKSAVEADSARNLLVAALKHMLLEDRKNMVIYLAGEPQMDGHLLRRLKNTLK